MEAINLGTILRAVAQYFNLVETEITGKRTGHGDERGMALELMYRHGDVSQARIGERVGLDYTAVTRERKWLRDRIESDNRLKKRLQEIKVSILS